MSDESYSLDDYVDDLRDITAKTRKIGRSSAKCGHWRGAWRCQKPG